ncbi:MAG: SMP-30/gluconolactonase/LRE family protein [Paracoccaceae bacterium]
MIFDERKCELGEGALWHPKRGQLYWFDVLGKRLLTRGPEGPGEWHFPHLVSAAGWLSRTELMIASEVALFRFDLETGTRRDVVALEAENAGTRSNDGRADPYGGFWIGTMGKAAEKGAGSIWRYFRGSVRRLYNGMTIPNAISFTADGRTAHFTDTVTARVMRVALDADGWPRGEPELYLDLAVEGLNPDGAVCDAEGQFWGAQWGAGRVACYAPDGSLVRTVEFDAPHTSCPAFGGPEMTTLYCTTALEHMSPEARLASPKAGMTFAVADVAKGVPEPMVIL